MSTQGNATVKSVSEGTNIITKTGNWDYAANKLTLKTAYLSTLSDGDYNINIELDSGEILTVKVTVKTTP